MTPKPSDMIKQYIQLGHYAFIEIPDKEKAESYIDDVGICRHKWTDKDIQFGFSRVGLENMFIVNFYVAVGLNYHIYNIPIEAIEAEFWETTRTDGAFWQENFAGKGYPDEDKIKPKTTYVVVKILVAYPLSHISDIIETTLQKINQISTNPVESKYKNGELVHYFLGEKIGANWSYEKICSYISAKHHGYMEEFIRYRDYQTCLMPRNYSCLDIELLRIRNRITLLRLKNGRNERRHYGIYCCNDR